MNEVSIIGLDLAKNIFQAHGAAGTVLFYSGASCRAGSCLIPE